MKLKTATFDELNIVKSIPVIEHGLFQVKGYTSSWEFCQIQRNFSIWQTKIFKVFLLFKETFPKPIFLRMSSKRVWKKKKILRVFIDSGVSESGTGDRDPCNLSILKVEENEIEFE